jgi:hypothetical protein
MTHRFSKHVACCVLIAAGIMPVSAQSFRAGLAGRKAAVPAFNPGVAPIQSKFEGLTYGEWSTRFWQWEFSLPVTGHPLFQDGPVDCSVGQSGNVWFIGGTFTTNTVEGVRTGTANRSCTVPPGTALFFPIINSECSSVPPNPPFPGDNNGDDSTAGLRACSTGIVNLTNLSPNGLWASVDGNRINDVAQYRAPSPEFTFGPLPPDNIFESFGIGEVGASYRSVSDGYYLLLRPLSAGPHTIQFHGEFDFPDQSKFIEDITYHIYVTN